MTDKKRLNEEWDWNTYMYVLLDRKNRRKFISPILKELISLAEKKLGDGKYEVHLNTIKMEKDEQGNKKVVFPDVASKTIIVTNGKNITSVEDLDKGIGNTGTYKAEKPNLTFKQAYYSVYEQTPYSESSNESLNKSNKLTLDEDLFEESIKEGWESIDGLKFTRTGVHGEKLDDDWIDYGDYLVNKNRLQDEMLRDFKEENGYTRADEDRDEFWDEFDEFITERGLEYLDKTVNESLKEDLFLAPQEPSDETPETPEANGIAKLILDAINDESDTIKMYNDLIANTDNEDIIQIIQDITAEENNHIGMLQKALEIVSPNASNIEDGVEEAESMLSESLTESFDGWDEDKVAEVKEICEEVYNLGYELENTVRGAYTRAHTYSELGEYVFDLGDRLSLAGERLINSTDDEEEDMNESLNEGFWFGKYKDKNNEIHKVYFDFDSDDFDRAEEEFNEIIPDAYVNAKLYGRSLEQPLIRDGFVKIGECLKEDLHDKFKRDIKKAYKDWAAANERNEQKRREAQDFIPETATDEQIAKYNDWINKEYPQVEFKYDFPKNIEKDDYPFYVTYYAEYPIYEPAEGGYYYPGRDAIWSKGFNTEEEAIEFMRNEVSNDDYIDNWEEYSDGYISHGDYIGEDQMIVIEPKNAYLSQIAGWEPYQ